MEVIFRIRIPLMPESADEVLLLPCESPTSTIGDLVERCNEFLRSLELSDVGRIVGLRTAGGALDNATRIRLYAAVLQPEAGVVEVDARLKRHEETTTLSRTTPERTENFHDDCKGGLTDKKRRKLDAETTPTAIVTSPSSTSRSPPRTKASRAPSASKTTTKTTTKATTTTTTRTTRASSSTRACSAPQARGGAALSLGGAADDSEIFCGMCFSPDFAPDNQIVLCDGCDVGVHQECYGKELQGRVPEGTWHCPKCRDPNASKQELCLLCRRDVPSMLLMPCEFYKERWRSAPVKGFAHEACARVADYACHFENDSLIVCQEPPRNQKHRCLICLQVHGLAVVCSKGRCHNAAHVSCAQFSEHHWRVDLERIYCPKHANDDDDQDDDEKQSPGEETTTRAPTTRTASSAAASQKKNKKKKKSPNNKSRGGGGGGEQRLQNAPPREEDKEPPEDIRTTPTRVAPDLAPSPSDERPPEEPTPREADTEERTEEPPSREESPPEEPPLKEAGEEQCSPTTTTTTTTTSGPREPPPPLREDRPVAPSEPGAPSERPGADVATVGGGAPPSPDALLPANHDIIDGAEPPTCHL